MKNYRPTEPNVTATRTTDETPAQPKDGLWRYGGADGRCGFIALLVLLSAGLGAACQKLDPDLASGPVGTLPANLGTGGSSSTSRSGPGGSGAVGSGTGGVVGTQSNCPTLRTQAHDILEANCAICHEAPGTAALYSGPFLFVLDLARLTSETSPQSSNTLTLKYVVKGDPNGSYIYQRIENNSMPPANRTQRATAGDLQVLNQWITSCIDDSTSPQGWSGSAAPADGGVDAGATLPACGRGNLCPDGGCCVFNQCRPNGTTCGPLPNPIPGQTDLPGFPGMCTTGSCKNSAGNSCGKVGEPCCDLASCTASQSSCLTTDMTKCSACGGTGQPCCKPATCLVGWQCVGDGVGRVGTCFVCGGLNQPCCGTSSAALQTCNDPALTCILDPLQETRCTDGTSGTGGATGTGGAGGRGGAGAGGRGGAGAGGRGGAG